MPISIPMPTKSIPTKITFFEWLLPLVISGKKIITIRDEAESHYVPGTIVEVSALETGKFACFIKILSVAPLAFDEISEFHAEQECLPLDKLKTLISDIYPNIEKLYVINFELVND
ncbi:N(4)-acetylcytidine aminohydrolase [Moellerella wisconsensis]|uniref:N(4)-acetylcytidine amidohydrolase n=3 Tax=Moellerella wisconsensis TaxID=158849 RepID=A0A0N0IBB2_9GAMM|nr:N(4)-acetylcytidine aminohydrolase [Moellerella wisconsensis]KPD03660.1 hypothetical protein M992_0950 [Moellerella wisconsensis ATCC 35017]UNH23834.1 N(4)-acetylcytidine aminohydrolase [Moellerella wisconsensis]UNH26923.1 N(4)-acetylcytidine aminohydrolase [Moellerella wisconsensis]UNH30407.1 N(4)-acetylcytidine aminohydrolase [Moellerella wisconsensis]UNH38565.1 N(4)-acetylcytidine aminohydrolase [Moellerella wisconsensis]